ncbi:MAG: sigma-54-dependent Fis family transcriptional regulator, partial [Deltaproteobacteria bacterium]|nr:sigma-54-dependent Fis family transcriptional regulator [Deltaproteobacteria bacterium]
THHIHVPDLRERKDDLFLLIDHFLEEAARELDKKRPTPSQELYALLGSYYFPGNVRELQSMIYDSVSHHQSKMLSMDRFKEHIAKHSSTEVLDVAESSSELEASEFFSFFKNLPTLKAVRQLLIDEAVRRSDGNKAVAAQILGISRSGLAKLLKRSEQV